MRSAADCWVIAVARPDLPAALFDRFTRAIGMAPMEYLLAWRMAIAKALLRRQDVALEEVAERVGYRSASTFSTAFSRHVDQATAATPASGGVGSESRAARNPTTVQP